MNAPARCRQVPALAAPGARRCRSTPPPCAESRGFGCCLQLIEAGFFFAPGRAARAGCAFGMNARETAAHKSFGQVTPAGSDECVTAFAVIDFLPSRLDGDGS